MLPPLRSVSHRRRQRRSCVLSVGVVPSLIFCPFLTRKYTPHHLHKRPPFYHVRARGSSSLTHPTAWNGGTSKLTSSFISQIEYTPTKVSSCESPWNFHLLSRISRSTVCSSFSAVYGAPLLFLTPDSDT